jgi:hypothetical protein
MFFVDSQHKLNFDSLIAKFPQAIKENDYKSACYIAAHPEIFKCFNLGRQIDCPFDWYFDYLEDSEDFIKRRDQGRTTGDTAPLTGATRSLIDLALNLWNGYSFDLGYGLSVWDKQLYKTALQAIDLKRHNGVDI